MAIRLRRSEASDAWRALLTAFARVNGVLADEMDAETALPLARYEILLLLIQAEDGALRPSELAERRRLSRSGATGRVHLRGIEEHVGSHLTSDEMAELRRILTKLADGVGGTQIR